MAKRQRLRREDPERTVPLRNFSSMFRPDGKLRGGNATPAANAPDDISNAVRMGYSVIEEQIRQGQRAAQQLAGQASGMGTAKSSVTDIASRLLRYSTDLAALHFDLMGVLLQPTGANAAPGNVAAGEGSRVVIEIQSQRKNTVTLDLWPGKSTVQLIVPALHSAEADKSPLTDISFVAGTEEQPARMCIVIPDSQMAGVYSGLILDAASSQASGTLSIKLDD